MKFTVSTKPLVNALDIGFLKNVSKNDKIGSVAQVTMEGAELRINFQYPRLFSELVLKGAPEKEDSHATVFVDATRFKSLISTFDSNTVVLDFVSGGLEVHSGKSKFNVPKMLDEDDISLERPNKENYSKANESKLDVNAWQYVRDNQLHTITISHTYPVYNMVYVGESGDVLAGDVMTSLFSYSHEGDLNQTCLLSTTLIEMLSSIPGDATVVRSENNYLVVAKGEGYVYTCEFKPQHESDAGMGDYNSDIILQTIQPPTEYVEVDPEAIRRSLGQATLLNVLDDTIVTITISSDEFKMVNKNVDCVLDVKSTSKFAPMSGDFQIEHLRKILKPYVSDTIKIGFIKDEDQPDDVKGIIIFDEKINMVAGGME